MYEFKDFVGSSHRILIDLIRRHSPRGGTLVDLGAAGGELSEAVKNQFARRIAFELDAENVRALRSRFDRIIIANLDQVHGLPRASAIVMADVLEHLRDSRRLLRIVRQALEPDGVLYLSVPNVANITMRLSLLLGQFNYEDRGILDRTHLRFYTFKTIAEELESEGFDIVDRRASAMPVRLVIGKYVPEAPLRAGETILHWMTQAWRTLFAYQVILVARPRPR